jgi:sporulation protein YpjB
MKAWIVGFLCLCVAMIPLNAHADSPNPFQRLTDLANRIYQDISENQLETATNDLANFKKVWETLSNKDVEISPVAIRTIKASEEKLSRSVKLENNEKELNETSVEFQLAVDALVNSEHPLWMGMKDKVIGAFSKVEQDVKADDDQSFQVHLNQFIDLYQMVYPSMTIDIKPDVLKKLDSKMNHIINHRMTIVQDKENHLSHLKATQEELEQLFGGTEETSGLIQHPKLFPPSLFIGGLVVLTLLYVVWRKYKGEDKPNTHMTVTK